MALIDYYIDSQAAVISLNDKENYNRLTPQFLNDFSKILGDISQSQDIRVVILRSTTDVFCYGMDLSQLENSGKDSEKLETAASLYMRLLYSIYSLPKPVICLVQGPVKAGGMGLVAASDIVLCSNSASFELSEVLFGLIPANVLPYILSLRMPPQKARYLVLTSKRLHADEALRLGLADEVFDKKDFEKETKKIIKQLYRSSPNALAQAKKFTADLFGKEFSEARDMALDKLIELVGNSDLLDGIEAFNSGDLPSWFSRFKPEKTISGENG